jgi:N-methylhydantoinase B
MPKPARRAADPVTRQILWNRLIAVTEEQATTMVRAAFSPPVREGGDLSAGVFDLQGRMLAQAVTGTPGHVNTMMLAVPHFLEAFPVETMRPGDAYITNDPWIASGHLHDVTVLTPAFHRRRLVGLFAATVHIVDVGGRGMGTDAREVYEEGVFIPPMALAAAGRLNEDLLTILRANSREPLQLEGDLLAILAAGDEGARRLAETLDEFAEADLAAIGDHIVETSRAATEEAIARLKPGTYRYTGRTDGYEAPVELAATMTIGRKRIGIDFAGSSPQSRYGINVVLNYTRAYTAYGIKCLVAPDVPNNTGSLAPFEVTAPEGCILNPRKPAAVAARHIIGHALPDVAIGCLVQAMPGAGTAESGMMWNPYIRGPRGFDGAARPWEMFYFQSGGMGARADKDGLDATAFPAGIKNIPVEASETAAPVVFWRKELRPDSGGPGRFRGGLGQLVEIGGLDGQPLRIQAMFDRVESPARGREGGGAGAAGGLRLASGPALRAKGQQDVPEGDRLLLELPGGGGWGNPRDRDRVAVEEDLREGLITEEEARATYGWARPASA